MQAKAIDAVTIFAIEKMDSVTCLVVVCQDCNEFLRLPKAVKFEGQVYGKTGWNSDRYVAYFRNDAKVGFLL